MFILNLQLLNVETGEIEEMATDRCACTVEQLFERVTKLAQNISGTLLHQNLGGIKITSSPEGASVQFDEKEAGQTPLVLSDLKPGEYRITISLEGYNPSEERVTVSAGEITDLDISLSEIPQKGSLGISTNVLHANVYLNGRRIGQTPLPSQNLDPNKYKVRISKKGYSDWDKMVEVKAGEKQIIQAELEKVIQKAKPWYKQVWVWTIILVAAGGVAGGIILTVGDEDGDTGEIDIYL